ncbi:MAG: hypothetical protein CMJ19_17775 [Phycisphaeraceae bacterium]|nr:hypothetical protein [Phycisphaeraceae bacterium]
MTNLSTQTHCQPREPNQPGRCIVFDAKGVRLDTFPIAALQTGQALVQTTCSCISPGTELRELGKMVDGSSEHAGKTIVPGYARVGRVIDPGDTELTDNQRVVIIGTHHTPPHVGQWGGQADHAICTADQLISIPDDVDDVQAVLARLAAISCHGFNNVTRYDDDRIAVIGLGAIGLFSARFFASHGYDVIGLDRSATRVDLAKQWGIEAQVVTRAIAKHIREHFEKGADIIVDATGVPAVIDDAVDGLHAPYWNVKLDKHVRYIFQGSYKSDITFNYWPFFQREAKMFFPRDWEPGDLDAIFQMIQSGKVHFPEFLYSVHDPSDAPAAYQSLKDPQIAQVTTIFRWHD